MIPLYILLCWFILFSLYIFLLNCCSHSLVPLIVNGLVSVVLLMIYMNNVNELPVIWFEAIESIINFDILLGFQNMDVASLVEQYFLLPRIRRVCLKVHAHPIEPQVVLAADHEEHRLRVRGLVLKSELEGDA